MGPSPFLFIPLMSPVAGISDPEAGQGQKAGKTKQ